MKREKMNKTWFWLLIIAILTLGGISGCQKATIPQKEGASADNGNQSFSTIYDLEEIVSLTPMKIRFVNAGVVENTLYKEGGEDFRGHLALGLEVANTSEETVWFFPEQFQVVLNTGEKADADISISSDIGGQFPERRMKKGFLLFPISNTDPDLITEFTIQMSAPLNENHQPLGEDQELVIKLK